MEGRWMPAQKTSGIRTLTAYAPIGRRYQKSRVFQYPEDEGGHDRKYEFEALELKDILLTLQ
jgi:hypothetical protein